MPQSPDAVRESISNISTLIFEEGQSKTTDMLVNQLCAPLVGRTPDDVHMSGDDEWSNYRFAVNAINGMVRSTVAYVGEGNLTRAAEMWELTHDTITTLSERFQHRHEHRHVRVRDLIHLVVPTEVA